MRAVRGLGLEGLSQVRDAAKGGFAAEAQSRGGGIMQAWDRVAWRTFAGEGWRGSVP